MAILPVYEKDLTTSLCLVDSIQLNEYDNSINDINYIYSGLTLLFDLTGFTTHFDVSGHTYNNFILNNDVYTYTGLTGEIHYFRIFNFYSGATPTIDPLLTGFTISGIISGFTTSIIHCVNKLDGLSGTCCPTQSVLSDLPWVAITNEGGGNDNCSNYIARRNEKGWTLDYVFNKNGATGWTNSVFFYTGVRDEYDPINYTDNNLSFKFTNDGRIAWEAYRYSGYCDTVSGYTPIYYISTGQTLPLCSGGTSNNFDITIIFERHNYYTDCELPNEGGWNDLIHTGITSTTGSTIVTGETAEQLNVNWLNERDKRLGTLKIYHNGKLLQIDAPLSPIPNFRNLPVYEFKNWEEVILSDRGFQPFVHAVGGGVTGSGNIHNSICCYTIKYAAYFEDIMTFIDLQDRYINVTLPSFNIVECNEECDDNIVEITPTPSPSQVSPSITPTITPSVTPSISVSRSVTPSLSPSISISKTLTPSISFSKSVTPSKSLSRTASVTPTRSQSTTPTKSLTPTKSQTPIMTPTVTLSRSVKATPSITKTPTQTPTMTKTPRKSPTPTASISSSVPCVRPNNLTPHLFLSSYNAPPITGFTSSYAEACYALSLYGSRTFYGVSGFTQSLSTAIPVYSTGTTCTFLATGYYIIDLISDVLIAHINNGYLQEYMTCP